MRTLYLFLGILENIYVPGDARFITIVGEHLGDEVYNVELMDTIATQLEMIHGRLGGDVRVDDLVVTELAYPCVFDSVND